jgi:hypothetical protein
MAEIILDKRPDRYDCEIRTGRGHRPLLGNAGAGMNQILDARAVPATVSTRKTKAPRYAAGLLTGAGWGLGGLGARPAVPPPTPAEAMRSRRHRPRRCRRGESTCSTNRSFFSGLVKVSICN